MLNISENSVADDLQLVQFQSFRRLKKNRLTKFSLYLSVALIAGFFMSMFLPWTQNIQAKGYVTTRLPEQKPQSIQSVLSGRLEKWFVREGDYVEAGDTIIYISEIKSEYFDPDLIARTSEQVAAKSGSITSYSEKVDALDRQYNALMEGMQLKLQQTRNKILQARNKISIDSIDLVAYRNNLSIAENQLDRSKTLYEKGLKSLSELQEKELKVQSERAKVNGQENKLLNQRNEAINLQIELAAVERDYADKLAKSRSDKYSALSAQMEATATTAKLRNQLSNYNQRQKLYYITAPQAGYITKAVKKGIGEVLKEGTDIITIMPAKYDLAVEIYVVPQDLPLLDIGTEVRLRFDGWPAIVISGWPEAATGIFPGEVIAIDQFISDNGAYRLLIGPLASAKQWPERLRVGTGTNAFMLLKNVPLWYELWRQLNGFPPDFYQDTQNGGKDLKRKPPIKSIK